MEDGNHCNCTLWSFSLLQFCAVFFFFLSSTFHKFLLAWVLHLAPPFCRLFILRGKDRISVPLNFLLGKYTEKSLCLIVHPLLSAFLHLVLFFVPFFLQHFFFFAANLFHQSTFFSTQAAWGIWKVLPHFSFFGESFGPREMQYFDRKAPRI